MSQSKDLWDYTSVRKWSWTLILKPIGEQTPNEIIKCNSCLDPSCMNKAQNNMKQVTHQYDQLLILFKQAFELIEKMLSNISENEYKKLTNADWKKFFEYCQNFRGGSWCRWCRKVEAKINLAVFSISSCPKVNFLLANDKTLIILYSSQKEIYFWTRGNGKNG